MKAWRPFSAMALALLPTEVDQRACAGNLSCQPGSQTAMKMLMKPKNRSPAAKQKNTEQHDSTWPFKLWHNEKHALKHHAKSPEESVELAPPPRSRGWSNKWCLQEVWELRASNWKRWCQWKSPRLWSHNLSQEVVEEGEEATSRRACQSESNAIQKRIWKASARKAFPALATVMKSKERQEAKPITITLELARREMAQSEREGPFKTECQKSKK